MLSVIGEKAPRAGTHDCAGDRRGRVPSQLAIADVLGVFDRVLSSDGATIYRACGSVKRFVTPEAATSSTLETRLLTFLCGG